uniref:Zonadhesin n=1 Tax=Zeugodacus cucurbitae TaxID=28588 RepID=A0A0A1WUY2_ZEUCU
MISRHVSVCYSLTCALLAFLVCACAPVRAAPTGEPDTAAQGSAATLEVSRIRYDLANTIPIGFAAANAQSYVSTDVDTEAEVAPTSLPMTNEEMALAEVAAVVAELATTAAAELKVRDQGEDVAKEQLGNSRSVKADRQEVNAPELANVVEALDGVTVNNDDFITATTFRTNLPHQINTTPITTTISPSAAHPIAPSTATESPAILDELVRAAVAANEILAAALNVATMAVTNINATVATTTTQGAPNLATTLQPEAASSTTAVADQAQMSDSEILPEPTAWQPNEIEKLSTTTIAEVTTAIPDYTTTSAAVADKPTDNASVSIEVNDDTFFVKELETTPIDIQETTIASKEKSAAAETTDFSKVGGLTNSDEDPKRTLADADNEVSESMRIEKSKESQETLSSPPPNRDNDLENSTSDAENLVINTIGNIMTQTEPVAESATDVVPVTTENLNETAEIEELKFEEDKIEQKGEGDENMTTTTESLETLIAVESEARVPSKSVLISEKDALEETTTTTPQQTTIMSESIMATNEATTTTTAATTEKDLLTETTTIEATTNTTVAPTILITTTGAQEGNIATTESADIKTDGPSASEQSEKLEEAIVETTTPTSPTDVSNIITEASDENQIVAITTSKLPAAEATTIFEEELSTSPLALTENYKETADIETSTNSIEEPITVTRIPFIENTYIQSTESIPTTTEPLSTESSRSSTDAPTLPTITTLATEEIQHLEVSANQANFEAFPNAALTEVSPQITTQRTEDITTTTLSTSPETTTTSSATTAPEIEDTILGFTKVDSTAQIREQMPTTTEEVLGTTIITTEKTTKSEDAVEPEAKTDTTTVATIEEQPFHMTTEKEDDSALTTTNTIVAREESTTDDADVTSSAEALSTTTPITADITTVSTPEVEVTTTISTTTPEPDITTTTTTTTLSPMSLIVAEHEARSLDRTPPRVSRIVNEDGVEVLTGYSIVHHMHAAALAALAAEGA